MNTTSKREYVFEMLSTVKSMINENRPKFEIARVLGVKYETLNKYLKEFGIEYKGNPNRKGIPHEESRVPLGKILKGEVKHSCSNLRKRLLDEGIKEKKCECCGITNWMGKELRFELHHIDGNHYNNSLDNLQILCPNCHSQTDGFRKSNK